LLGFRGLPNDPFDPPSSKGLIAIVEDARLARGNGKFRLEELDPARLPAKLKEFYFQRMVVGPNFCLEDTTIFG
jgi:hypothetical protein